MFDSAFRPSGVPRAVYGTRHSAFLIRAAAFGAVPDPWRIACVCPPLPVILAMAVAAILDNHVFVLALSEDAARQRAATRTALGCVVASRAAPDEAARQGVASDGKAQPGRLRAAGEAGPVTP